MNWLLIRRLVQGFFFLLFIYIIWMTKYPLNWYLNPSLLFHMDPLIMIITSIAERLIIPGFLISLLVLLITFVFGRVFCGWFCPLGAAMDITAKFNKKILQLPGIKQKWNKKWRCYNEKEPSGWQLTKYILFLILIILAFSGIQSIWFFDPLAIFVRTFSFHIHPLINNTIDSGLVSLLDFFPDFIHLELFYYWLKDILLDISTPDFPYTNIILIIFISILLATIYQRRYWCRYICPLGALLGICSRFSLFKRKVNNCSSNCGVCQNICPTNAIKNNNDYHSQECIMCMQCTQSCPTYKNIFTFQSPFINQKKKSESIVTHPDKHGLSRADFLLFLGSSLTITACSPRIPYSSSGNLLRPPGAINESHFIDRCVRCGNCMKICPTNVLQPALAESGFSGIWSPKMNFPASYCEHDCNLCGMVCPTGAIKKLSLEKKHLTKIGIAVINHKLCIPWIEDVPCLVCEEHCPIPNKAIKKDFKVSSTGLMIARPVIDKSLCIGCGICENKCPVNPKRAINIIPLNN